MEADIFDILPWDLLQVRQDGGVDGQCGDGHTESLCLQSLHLCRVQERKGQLSGETEMLCRDLTSDDNYFSRSVRTLRELSLRNG